MFKKRRGPRNMFSVFNLRIDKTKFKTKPVTEYVLHICRNRRSKLTYLFSLFQGEKDISFFGEAFSPFTVKIKFYDQNLFCLSG